MQIGEGRCGAARWKCGPVSVASHGKVVGVSTRSPMQKLAMCATASRFHSPSIEQLQQRVLIGIELLQGLALDASTIPAPSKRSRVAARRFGG
jgi:hypothetical protein